LKVGNYRRKLSIKGQSIYEFQKIKLFLLRERYHKAYLEHWEGDEDEIGKEGVGINTEMYRYIPLEKLLIFEEDQKEFFLLKNTYRAGKTKGSEMRNGTRLYIIPLSCFESVIIRDFENIKRSPVPIEDYDKTVQEKLDT